jgi:hypothetical protein
LDPPFGKVDMDLILYYCNNMPNRFGTGSNSNGQFWYGSATNFPGFLYKKNLGVGARRSTKFTAGGNITTNCSCGEPTYLYNKYKPGTGGVGASSTANRRAKNRLASVHTNSNGTQNSCCTYFQYLGRYNNYTSNPNGFFPEQIPGIKTTYISPATNYPY